MANAIYRTSAERGGVERNAGRAAAPQQPLASATAANTERAGAARPTRQRIPLFDNIKGLLIILVVAGHIMHPVHNDNPALSCIFDVMYLFHMPLFVFTSGLFAKSAYRNGHLKVDRIISFLVLGALYQLAIMVINGAAFTWMRFLRFSSAPWYLISMAWWYLLTPLLARMKPGMGLVASLVASLAWGFVDMSGGFLAISRTFSFLPWFALGYYCPLDAVQRLKRQRWLWIAVGAAVLIALARVFDEQAYRAFFYLVYGDNPYRFGARELIDRLTLIVISLTFSLAVLKLVPERASFLTVLGKRTLAIYVLHRLVRAWLTFHTGYYNLPFMLDPIPGILTILATAGIITAVCALPCFTTLLDRVMSVPWTHAFHRVRLRRQP